MGHATGITRHRAAGFTLIELMVTILLVAILTSIAVPSFEHIFKNTRLTGVSNDLLADIKYARTEAVSHGSKVAIAASAGAWTNGWKIQVEPVGGNPAILLRVHDVIAPNYQLAAGTAAGDPNLQLEFDARGALASPQHGICFTIKAPTGSTNKPRQLVVRSIGTVSQFTGTAAAGTHCGS